MVKRPRLGVATYTGWCHAGSVVLILGVSFGGGKYSFSCARGVELNCLAGAIVCVRAETHRRHVRDEEPLELLTRSWRGSEKLIAALPFKMDAALGRTEAYIARWIVSSNEELTGLMSTTVRRR